MLEIKPFAAEHVRALTAREPDRTIAVSVGNYFELAKEYAKHPSWTGFWDGVPMVSAGIIVLWPGLGEGWALTSHLAEKFPCAFHRAIKRKLEEVVVERHLRRIQVAIPKTHMISRRWIMRLGFLKEGAMRYYGVDGSTHVRYVRFFNTRESCPQ